VPDIAIGNLIRIRGQQLYRWQGDLLIGSYMRKLWRVRVRDGRVVYAEPIEVMDRNARVRDIIEDAQGRIVLLLDGGSIAIVTAVSEEKKVPEGVVGADSMRGQLIFAQCLSCHRVGDGKNHGIGPDLAGIAGRSIASAQGFIYSAGLSAVSGPWSDESLDRFLAGPQQFAPGTTMAFPGIESPSDRARLIRYLKTLHDTK
jgi:cytochrome c